MPKFPLKEIVFQALCLKGKARKCRSGLPIYARTSPPCPAIRGFVGPKRFRSCVSERSLRQCRPANDQDASENTCFWMCSVQRVLCQRGKRSRQPSGSGIPASREVSPSGPIASFASRKANRGFPIILRASSRVSLSARASNSSWEVMILREYFTRGAEPVFLQKCDGMPHPIRSRCEAWGAQE